MDMGYIAILNRIAFEESRSQDAMDRKKGEVVEDAIMDGV